MRMLRVEAITDYDAFRGLEPIWNPLLARTDTDVVFLTFEWLTTWWECFGANADLLVLVVRSGDEPVALAPLMLNRHTRQVSFLANTQSMRASFLLTADPEESLRAILAYLAGSGLDWDRMVFNYIPEDSVTARSSATACRVNGLRPGYLPSLISPYTTLTGQSWDGYLETRDSKFRKNLRYYERRLYEGESGHAEMYRSPDDLDEVLPACREVALASWQHEHGTSIASTSELWGFYSRLAKVAAARGWLRIGLLRAAGRAVGFEYTLAYGATMYGLKAGYHPDFRHCSPGHVLSAFMMQTAISEGCNEYDMVGMNDSYKMKWATGERRHTCLCVAGRGVRAALHHWVEFGAKRRLRRWPAAVALKHWLDARRGAAHNSREMKARAR
jgi:CelD/BcsL family acetyltransferase involved in cellulose biosynthesis